MIRQAVLEDLDQITLLVRDVGKLHAQNRSDIFLPDAVTADKDKCKKRLLGEKYYILVEEKDGQLNGLCMAFLRMIENDIKLRNTKVLRIEELVVRQEARSKGIASALLRAMKKYALDNGCSRIEANVWGFNRASQALLHREQFTVQQQTVEYSFEKKEIGRLYQSSDRETARHQSPYKAIEISNTLRHLFREINPEMSILDCAAGNGTYAVALCNRGNSVTASDLSASNVAYMRKNFAQNQLPIRVYQDNTLDLSRYSEGTFDTVICMGPAYHLNKTDVETCLKECLRIVKKGGKVLVSYLNKNYWGPYILEHKASEYTISEILEMMETGTFLKKTEGFIGNAFFYSPGEMRQLVEQCIDVHVSNHFTLDGNWQIAYESIAEMEEKEKKILTDYIFSYAEHPEQIAGGKNNMIVIRKGKQDGMQRMGEKEYSEA